MIIIEKDSNALPRGAEGKPFALPHSTAIPQELIVAVNKNTTLIRKTGLNTCPVFLKK